MTTGSITRLVRDRGFGFIKATDGSEELYDHDADPHEWSNEAADLELDAVVQELARWLPQKNAPSAESSSDDGSERGPQKPPEGVRARQAR